MPSSVKPKSNRLEDLLRFFHQADPKLQTEIAPFMAKYACTKDAPPSHWELVQCAGGIISAPSITVGNQGISIGK
jgi:hypothetical protein